MIGCGPVGLMAIRAARHLGAEMVYAIDRGDGWSAPRKIADIDWGKPGLPSLDVSADGFEELASFQALPDSMTLNPPALAHGLLYVRNQEELACFDLRSPR